MITFIGSENGMVGPRLSPRLWVKFEDSDVGTEAYRLCTSALSALSVDGKYDRKWYDNNVGSNGQILSWEFPANWQWNATFLCLEAHGAKEVGNSVEEMLEFMNGFSRDR